MIARIRIIALLVITLIGGVAITGWHDSRAVANGFIIAIGALAVLFVGIYAMSNWTQTAAGRAVMRLMACLAVICVHGTIVSLWGLNYPGVDWVRPILWLCILLAISDMVITFVIIQRGGKQ